MVDDVKKIRLDGKDKCVAYECMQAETSDALKDEVQRMGGVQDTNVVKINHIGENQENIRESLNQLDQTITVMNGTLGRIFELYQNHEERLEEGGKRLEEIKIYMARKDEQNGHAEKESVERKADIKEFRESRKPMLDRLTKLEESKANKEDVTEVLVAVNKIGTTLDDHCQFDKEQKAQKAQGLERKDKYIIYALGAIVTICIFLAGFLLIQG